MSWLNVVMYMLGFAVGWIFLFAIPNGLQSCDNSSVLSPVTEEKPVCVPVLTVPEEEIFGEEEESGLTMLPEEICGSMRGYVICGIEDGVVIMMNDCWLEGDNLTPEEKDHYCGEGQAGGIYR